MKSFIYKNYNIKIDKIYIKNNQYYFLYNNEKIRLIKYKGEEKYLDELIKISNQLYYNSVFVDTFIINNNNSFYTKKDDYYLLLLKCNQIDCEVDFNDLVKFFDISAPIKTINIVKEWSTEIDELEKMLIEYNKEFEIIQNCIDYYIGLGENAIELMNNYENFIERNNDSIGHKVTYRLFECGELYNPFTFIKVNKMYDISNYIKYKIINNNLNYDEIDIIIDMCNEYEEAYLFGCLLYRNDFFDLVKKIMLKEVDEEIINKYNNYNKYIELLLYFQKHMKKCKEIKLIHWINK